MKIDKRITPPAAAKATSATAKSKGAGKAASPAGEGRDSLTLTESGSRLQALESGLASLDVADLDKIEATRAALANGSFAVDAGVVADRLIDQTKEILRKRPRKK